MAEQTVEQLLADLDMQRAEQGESTLDDVQLEKVKSMMDEQKQLIRDLHAQQQDSSQSEMIELQAKVQAAQQALAQLSSTLEQEQQVRANILKNIH